LSVTSIQFPAANVLLLLVVLISPAAAQQNDRESAQPPSKPRHVYTNDDIHGADSPDALPEIPGLIKCGKDLKCFLQALDSATPAALTRSEAVEAGTGLVTSNSTWWTTQYAADRCTVSFRVDMFEAKVNEKVVPAIPQAAHDAAAAKITEMNLDFESIRGKTETCTLPVKNLKALMISPYWSLVTLGPASNYGKNCSGPAFDSPHGPLLNNKK